MSCWRRYPRWRSTSCRTIIRRSTPHHCSCRSPHCAKPNRLRSEWRRSSTARCGTCCATPAASSCGKAAAATSRPMRPLFATAAQALGIPRAVVDVAGEEARGATGHYDTYCLHFRICRLRACPPYWLGQPCVGSRHKPFIRSPRRHASALTAVLQCRAPWLS
jgi:hypothetical protein